GTYTYHQTRQLLLDRPNPDFERSLSKRMSKSLNISTGETNIPLPHPQTIEPFFQTHQISIPEKDEDEDTPTPEYAHIRKKPERPPVTPPRTPQASRLPEVKPKRTQAPVAYANLPPEPPPRPPVPRETSPTMDPEDALLAAIRLATDLDPNKQANKIVMANS
ncbi:unnamed protein product, partial [Adineta steineri]